MTAPIALFTYNRPEHTTLTVDALKRNRLADQSELFIFSDGPRDEADAVQVALVRNYLKGITGFKEIAIIERDRNLGLAQSIITGVTEIVGRYGSVIVLEDDMVTSPYFLQYMNEGLVCYRDDDDVISIHGYLYPLRGRLPETFFLRGADCWGWATWQRGWKLFEPDGRKLLDELRARELTRRFDFDGAYNYTHMLEEQVAGKNNSWAIRWYASAFLRDKVTLYPGRSLVHNTGMDASGTHCEESDDYRTELSQVAVQVRRMPAVEDRAAWNAFRRFFLGMQPTVLAMVMRPGRALKRCRAKLARLLQ